MSHDVVKKKIKKIKNIIDRQGKYGYYLIDDSDVKLIGKGNDTEELKNRIIEKLQDNSQKYMNNFIYLVEININEKYIEKTHKNVGGPLSLRITQYRITKNNNLKHEASYINGAIWYSNQDLEQNKFRLVDVKKLIQIINDQNMEIVNIGTIRAVDILDDFN